MIERPMTAGARPPALPVDPPPRSPWLQALALAVMFLGSGLGGTLLVTTIAPGSFLAAFAGAFAFPLAFGLGMPCWLGLALATALWGRVRHGPRKARPHEIPGGSIAFVPVSIGLAGVAGLVVGLSGSRIGAVATLALYLLLGTVHGVACWQLARRGYLPFPVE
jgi:hypothetical protein